MPSWASAAWEGIVVRGPGNERGNKARGEDQEKEHTGQRAWGPGWP